MANPAQKEITLPAGFILDGKLINKVCVRELMDTEEDLMSDPENIDQLVFNCITRIGESIIERPMINNLAATQCLYRDWEYMLFEIRKLTEGNNYQFGYVCAVPTCKRENEDRKLDLRVVKIKKHQDPMNRKWEFISRDGTKFLFRDKLWTDAEALAKIAAERERALVRLMAVQLEEVNGVKIISETWQEHVEQAVNLLKNAPSWNERNAIRKTMNERDFGIDREVLDDCQFCGATCKHSFAIDLRFLFTSMK